MEEYKTPLKETAVPSLFILLITVSSILFGYAQKSLSFSGITVLVTSLLLLPFVYKNSIKKDTKKGSGKGGIKVLSNLLPLLFLITISVIISFTLINRIHHIINTKPAAKTAGLNNRFYGSVLKVFKRRYNNEVIIKFAQNKENLYLKNNITRIAYIDSNLPVDKDDIIEFKANLKRINIDEISSTYELQLFRKGISYKINIIRSHINIIGKAKKNIISKIKLKLKDAIEHNFSPETASLLKALYFGNRNYIDKTTINDFKRAGLLHLLSASGLHVGILAAVPLLIFGFFRLNKRSALVSAFIIIMIYLYITSFPVSLLRASIMFGVYSLQEILDLNKNIYNTLFISAIIILIMSPFELYNPGFQLSFGATMGILLFFKKYRESFSYLPDFLADSISVTLSAQLIVMPVILFHMGEINLSGFISNIIAVPLTGIILISSLFVICISFLYRGAAEIAGIFTDRIYILNRYFIKAMSSLNCHYTVDNVDLFLVMAFVFLFIPLLPNLYKRKMASLWVFVSLFIMWSLLKPGYSSAKNEIAIINHRKGKTLVIKEDRKIALIGQLPPLKETMKLAAYLERYSFENFSIFVMYPDFSNITASSYLIKKFVISKCFMSSNFFFSKHTKKFFQLIDMEKIVLTIYDPNKLNNSDSHQKTFYENTDIVSFDNIMFIYNMLINKNKDGNVLRSYYPDISLKETVL